MKHSARLFSACGFTAMAGQHVYSRNKFLEQTNLHKIKQRDKKTGGQETCLTCFSLLCYEKKPENSSGTCCAETMYGWTDMIACDHWKPNHIWKTPTLNTVQVNISLSERTERLDHLCQTADSARFPFDSNSVCHSVGCLHSVVVRNYCLARKLWIPALETDTAVDYEQLGSKL